MKKGHPLETPYAIHKSFEFCFATNFNSCWIMIRWSGKYSRQLTENGVKYPHGILLQQEQKYITFRVDILSISIGYIFYYVCNKLFYSTCAIYQFCPFIELAKNKLINRRKILPSMNNFFPKIKSFDNDLLIIHSIYSSMER